MEIGSFIELQFDKGKEYYRNILQENIARLNTGRAAIYHAARIYDVKIVYLPYYQCDTVRDFLLKKNIEVRYYYIDDKFNPDFIQADNSAVVIVNYYGIMSQKRLTDLSVQFKNAIIDNSQAFYAEPIDNCLNVYSARKFIGVPDGAYVIGKNANKYVDEYEQDYSSDTSLFILQRIEYGCEGKTYETRMINEHRLDNADIKKMSKLSQTIIDGTNNDAITEKRKKNFEIAHSLFADINRMEATMYYNDTCVPMVYPLVVEDDMLLDKLIKNKHFQGHWWSYLLNEVPQDTFEYWLSRFIIPITIDQRYNKEHLLFLKKIIKG